MSSGIHKQTILFGWLGRAATQVERGHVAQHLDQVAQEVAVIQQ